MGNWYSKDGPQEFCSENDDKAVNLSPEETRRELRELRYEFDMKATHYRRMATAMGSALALIEEAEKLKAEAAQRQKQDALQQSAGKIKAAFDASGASKTQDEFYFFVDGSGSMNGWPLTEALKAIAAATNAGPVKAMMWAEHTIKPFDNLNDPKFFKEAAQGFGCGTDPRVLVRTMDTIASSSKTPKHFVIVSDGDVYDQKQSKTSLGQILGKNSNASIDFVILRIDNGRDMGKTDLDKLSDSLKQVFPAQITTTSVDLSAGNVLDAFTAIVQRQLQSSAADASIAKKKQSAPAPK